MLPHQPGYQRDRRVAVKCPPPVAARRPGHPGDKRARKGLKACIKSAWRRASTGSNHISAYGVWRDHARRAMTRVNRAGETRWHRLPVAARAVNFFCEMP